MSKKIIRENRKMNNKTMIELDKPLDVSMMEYVRGWVKSLTSMLKIMAILGAGWLTIRFSTWIYSYGQEQYEKGWNWAKDYVLTEAMREIGYEKIELRLKDKGEGQLELKHGKDLSEKEKIIALTWNLNQLAMCRNTSQAVAEMLSPSQIEGN